MSRSDVTVDLEYLQSLEDSFKHLINVSAAAEALLTELDNLLEIEKRNVFGDVGCEKIESLRAALEKK